MEDALKSFGSIPVSGKIPTHPPFIGFGLTLTLTLTPTPTLGRGGWVVYQKPRLIQSFENLPKQNSRNVL